MKTIAHLLLGLTLALATASAHEKAVGGPNGGRLLTALEPHAEFLLLPDRKVQITFLDADDKPAPPTGQTVTVTTGSRLAPTTLAFAKAGDVLVSTNPVPAGDNLPVVVQIKPSPEARAVVERFNLNLALCPDCNRREYACVCDH
jgi:hypothetical protein